MSIYVDGQEIKRIYVGGEGYIKKAYYGRNLVYEIANLFESGTAGTYTVFIDSPGIYEISICGAGGGGGGSATSHNLLGANGGSGAAFRGNVLLDRTTLTITVGKGGNGGNASGADAGRGSGGTLSRITDENSNVLITAGAGDGGHGTGNNYGGGGQGGTLTMGTAEVISYEIQSNGAASSTVSILGNGYGAGGARRSRASGTAGTNGYVRIKYIGPEPEYTFTINPTPSDATVRNRI